MPTKKTHEEFIKEMSMKQPNIEVIGTYQGGQIKIKCKCKIDGHKWEATPNNLLNGHGCPVCGKKIKILKQRKTHEQFLQELQQVNPNIEVLGTYKTGHNKILCRCKIDGYEWEPIPATLLQGIGCPKCAGKPKRTHEQFIKELAHLHPNIQVLGTYKNTATNLKCKCKICEHEWNPTPNGLLAGRGCPKCARVKTAQKLTKTHQQFIKELAQVNSDIEVLDTYKKGYTKIKVKCKVDGYEWESTPDNLLQGSGCPICAKITSTQKKTKPHKQFLKELSQINPNIQVLGTYKNGHTKILCKCKIHGNEWEGFPSSLLKGEGCPVCGRIKAAQSRTKTHEQFIKELAQINTNIELLSDYKMAKAKILCKCKKDGYEWETTPESLMQGCGCPKCAGVARRTHEEFIQELQEVNSDIEVLGTYENLKTKIKVKCKKDGYEWEANPNNLLRGSGCPKCGITKGEKRVAQYLDNIGIDYTYNKTYFNDLVGTGGGLMRPDFLIPSLKIWIEYDGEQHFKPKDFSSKKTDQEVQEQFKQVQQHDQIKNQYAEQHNWTLIRIPYWDYDNIEKILDSYLKQEQVI